MSANKIKLFRQRAALTQEKLAALSGTSQQQIHRAENGQVVKLELAYKICAALGKDLTDIFPDVRKAKKKLSKLPPEVPNNEASAMMETAGIDVDPREWTVIFHLRGGRRVSLNITSQELDLLTRCVEEPTCSFFVTTSQKVEAAVNLRHVIAFQPCWDYGRVEIEDDDEPQNNHVLAYMASQSEPMEFDVDPDQESDKEDPYEGNMSSVLFQMELNSDDPSESFVNFEDSDGEQVFLRIADIAMLTIPLWVTHPSMLDTESEPLDEKKS